MDWVAVETGATAGGVPDSNFCLDGTEGWVEHKATRVGTVKFRPLQPAWILRRSRAGGLVRIAVRDLRHDGDVLRIFDGAGVARLAGVGIDAAFAWQVGRWSGGPRSWPWPEVRTALTQRL
jgi:hypothetical protein